MSDEKAADTEEATKAVTVEGEEAPKTTEEELGQNVARVQATNPYRQPDEVPGAEKLSEDPDAPAAAPARPVNLFLEQDQKQLAGALYDSYSAAVGGVNFQGDALPTWEEFSADESKAKQTAGWLAVAKYVIDYV